MQKYCYFISKDDMKIFQSLLEKYDQHYGQEKSDDNIQNNVEDCLSTITGLFESVLRGLKKRDFIYGYDNAYHFIANEDQYEMVKCQLTVIIPCCLHRLRQLTFDEIEKRKRGKK
jgi:predicted transcriptional regulator